MALTNMAFPDIVAQFCGFLGGVEAKTGDQQMYCRIGNVRDIDLSEVSPTANTSENTAKVYDLFSLTDDLVVKGYFWYSDYTVGQNTYQRLNPRFKLYKRSTGQSKYTSGSYPSGIDNSPTGFSDPFSDGITAGQYFRSNALLLATYKAKLVLITEYYNGTWSIPNGFGVIMLYPTANTAFPATNQTWTHIVRNAMGDSWARSYWDSAPSTSIYYPYRGAGSPVLWISDEAFFQNWVRDYDPVFKLSDIMDIGEVGDPIQENDPSEPGGGEGDYDEGSDPVDFPTLPTGGSLSCGACKAYKMTDSELMSLFNKLWDINVFDLATYQKLMDNPLQAIITLNALPISLSGINNHVWLGNFDSEVNGQSIGQQYYTIDCGSVKLTEFWGSALDYSPYTKAAIFLPFIGIRDIDIDDVMNKTIQVKYNVDILTGDCVAGVKCGGSVLYKFTGNCRQMVPVSGQQSDLGVNGIKSILSGVAGIATGTAIGGAAGMVAAGASAANSVASSKFVTQRSGGLDGAPGLMDDFIPYLIIHRPIQSLAQDYKKEKGYTSNIHAKLNSLSGYTEVQYIHLEGIDGATDTELKEIENLLKEGVII